MNESKIQRYKRRLSALKLERNTWDSHWQEISRWMSPRTSRFLTTDRNRGEKLNQNIIDNTAGFALRTFTSGMMAGMTSPARPWFRLTTPDPAIRELEAVKTWLNDVAEAIREVFAKSNLYYVLPDCYRTLGLYGTGAFSVLEDYEETIRCYPFPVGSYYVSTSARGVVDCIAREYSYTVRQLVEEFGLENCSTSVKSLYDTHSYETWIDVVHIITPNINRDTGKVDAKNKPYISCWYEKSTDEDKFLRESGFDEFPVMVARWDVLGEDIYGHSPAMEVLGDVKQLQLEQRRKVEAIDKHINPPLAGDASLQNQRVSLLPGDVTYISGLTQSSSGGLRPIVDVNPQAIRELSLDIQEVQQRIRKAFYEDLMLMFATSETVGANVTAREVEERHQEKLLALGPYMERMNNDLLSPLLERTYAIMSRKGMIPPPPPELSDTELKIEYISIMAQAQKLVGLTGLERLTGYVGNIAAVNPDILDKLDFDQSVDEYAEMVGAPPRAVRSDDQVQEIRGQRAQVKQMEQMAAMAQPMQQAAQGAKTLSETDVTDVNALTRLIGAV